ncbi:MAG: hypothetical protein QOD83_2651 [Solirubrobacteraceae bacterium]|jgi:hypothetical protein|nr:hypothetical protein [Solirubrobacteraceae bacterium]
MSLQLHPSASNNHANLAQPDGRAQPSERDAIGSGAIAGVVRDAAVRATAAVGVGAIAVIHAVDSVGKWTETRYIFWLYMLLIAGCIVTAAALLFHRSHTALLAAAGLAATVIAFYVLDRTVGLPNAFTDIGNWVEPLGLASLVVEGFVVATGLGGFLAAGRRA